MATIWKRSSGISPACARACLGSPFETSESHGPDLCVAHGFRPTLSGPVVPYCLGMRTLHPAYRITDLATSLAFYGAIGFEQVGRVDLGDGVTLTMLKFPADEVVTLELVHRPPDGPVVIGSGFSHLAVQVDDLSGSLGPDARALAAHLPSCARVVPSTLALGPPGFSLCGSSSAGSPWRLIFYPGCLTVLICASAAHRRGQRL